MFSKVILEQQPILSKNWIWQSSRPPSAAGGPSGVRSHLSSNVL